VHGALRAAFLVLVALGLITAVVDAFGPIDTPTRAGTYGIEFRATDAVRTIRIVSASRKSPARTAGIASGALLRVEPPTSLFALEAAHAGDRATLVDVPTGHAFVLTAAPARPRAFDIVWAAIRLFTIAMALFIALAAPATHRGARAIAVFFATIGVLCNWRMYPDGYAVAGFVLRDAASIYGFPFFILFAARFNVHGVRHAHLRMFGVSYERIALGLGAAYAVEVAAGDRLFWQNRGSSVLAALTVATMLTIFASGLSALLTRYRHARGDMRQRLLWVFGTLAVSLSGAVVWLIQLALPAPPAWNDWVALTTALLPVGFAYAILRHHILDIRFAVNRVLVFTVVGAAVVAVFGVLEWLLDEVIRDPLRPMSIAAFFSDRANRVSAIVNAGASIVVFALLRGVHERVDEAVKRMLFSERERRLAELERTAGDLADVRSAEELAACIVRAITGGLEDAECHVYFADGRGDYRHTAPAGPSHGAAVPREDLALLRLARTLEPTLIAAKQSAIPGSIAVPICGAGELYGFVALCGAAARSFAPDEVRAAWTFMRAAAATLEHIRIAELEAELAELKRQPT